MSHARRKFDEALIAQSSVDPSKQKSTLAAQALKQIQALYRIEREIKELPAEQKQAMRMDLLAICVKGADAINTALANRKIAPSCSFLLLKN